ncbi:ubiquitin-conjugating enzyme E2 G1 [Marmota marmota marmota]|uniref:ubiquitin-conjugating enzyme E2 G1 n=1 Tax=Marmota marmota marmota TaxID=9994 RepID=UPI000762711D|nr:ubiquitin-conjugating enzyme E2 G1 [Marmota marmota marmota]
MSGPALPAVSREVREDRRQEVSRELAGARQREELGVGKRRVIVDQDHICNRYFMSYQIGNILNKVLFSNFAVDKNGDVCISILHEPGEDKYGYEKPEERWLPIHTVETIMISVISMLADPNGDSPANVDAAKEWREDRNGEFKRKVARCVRKSQETAFE